MTIITAPRPDINYIPVFSAIDQYLHTTGQIVTLGIDTEMLFSVDGKVVYPHLTGFEQTRDPTIVNNYGYTHDFHGDGYAFELCSKPATCLEYMLTYLGNGFKWIAESKFGKTVEMQTPTVYKVPLATQKSAPDDVKRLGCMPSVNVYGDPGQPGKLGKSIRTTGCHLHITAGQQIKTEKLASDLVKWADIIVGNVWNLVSPENPVQERLRRTAYGKAGEYRVRNYPKGDADFDPPKGVEYRVLPGAVMRHPVYLTLMFNLYRTALRHAYVLGTPPEEVSELARTAINKVDKDISLTVVNWLPFKDTARLFFHKLKETSLPALSPVQWHKAATEVNGHRAYAADLKITPTQNADWVTTYHTSKPAP
jgi:hypothetical protein